MNTELHSCPFPSAEDTRTCRAVSPPGSIPWRCSLQAYYGEHITLAATSAYLLFRKKRPRKRPYSEAAECLGQPGERFNLAHYVCAHLSSFGPKELPHDGEVEASIVLSQKLGELRGHNSKVQTSCRGHNSKVTVLAMCNLKFVYKHINTFVLMDVLPQPDRKHLCFMVCNSSSVSRQRQ